jgi:putative hemin transport protein
MNIIDEVTEVITAPSNAESLREQFHAFRYEKKMRHRDAARAMQMSEGEVIALHVGCTRGLTATRLSNEFPQLIEALAAVGPLMALTRNEVAVHERTGSYLDASTTGHVGLVLGADIDLRIFYQRWQHGFWVEEANDSGVNRSLQFFDQHGDAVHKIFERKLTDAKAFERAATLFFSDDQKPHITVTVKPPPPVAKDDVEIDITGLQTAWAAMQDTHEFFGLLRKFGVTRTQGLRLAGAAYAKRVGLSATRFVLEQASARFLEIMIFVPNHGCIQIHTGPVNNVQIMGSWLNVLDPDFNLHLREDLIAESWVVRKPTADGVVTSLEIFDAQGEVIAYLFGKRKPGVPELEAWRILAAEIAPLTEMKT